MKESQLETQLMLLLSTYCVFVTGRRALSRSVSGIVNVSTCTEERCVLKEGVGSSEDDLWRSCSLQGDKAEAVSQNI